MNYYTLTHEHRHGTETYVFKSRMELQYLPDEKDLAKALDIDYEPELLETIEVMKFDLDTLAEV